MEDWLKCQISPLFKYRQNQKAHMDLQLCTLSLGFKHVVFLQTGYISLVSYEDICNCYITM